MSRVAYYDESGLEIARGVKLPAMTRLFNAAGKDLGTLHDRAYHVGQANLDEAGEYDPYEECCDEYDAYVENPA